MLQYYNSLNVTLTCLCVIIIIVFRTKWKKQLTARMKIAQRQGLWPAHYLPSAHAFAPFLSTSYCQLSSAALGDNLSDIARAQVGENGSTPVDLDDNKSLDDK